MKRKEQKEAGREPEPEAKQLPAKAAGAERRVETARKRAQAAKLKWKHAKKALKRAKKAAKQARKAAKAAQKTVDKGAKTAGKDRKKTKALKPAARPKPTADKARGLKRGPTPLKAARKLTPPRPKPVPPGSDTLPTEGVIPAATAS